MTRFYHSDTICFLPNTDDEILEAYNNIPEDVAKILFDLKRSLLQYDKNITYKTRGLSIILFNKLYEKFLNEQKLINLNKSFSSIEENYNYTQKKKILEYNPSIYRNRNNNYVEIKYIELLDKSSTENLDTCMENFKYQ